MNFEEKIKNNI